jgi:phytoene synthase
MKQLPAYAKKTMKKGSKSFSFAALFLPKDFRQGARYLYTWCRYCDDVVDSSSGETAGEAKAAQLAAWTKLREQTEAALAPDAPELDPIFLAFRQVMKQYSIPEVYAFDLLEGMRMDLEHRPYQTIEELETYCYHVASTVGLMMCSIMGVSDPRALPFAASLGTAMQLTNIARDVKEDYLRGRVYLPQEWLSQPADLLNDPLVFSAIEKLLERAELRYAQGLEGVSYLSWQNAVAIRLAGSLYREIGREVLKKRDIHQRAHPSLGKKLLLAGESLFLRDFARKNSNSEPLPIWRPL